MSNVCNWKLRLWRKRTKTILISHSISNVRTNKQEITNTIRTQTDWLQNLRSWLSWQQREIHKCITYCNDRRPSWLSTGCRRLVESRCEPNTWSYGFWCWFAMKIWVIQPGCTTQYLSFLLFFYPSRCRLRPPENGLLTLALLMGEG